MSRVASLHTSVQAVEVDGAAEVDEALVVAPRGKLCLRAPQDVAERLDRQLARDQVADRLGVVEHREEALRDELVDMVVDDGSRGGAAAGGVLDAAPVAAVLRGPAHRVPAAGAAEEACEEAGRADRATVGRGVRGGEDVLFDERLVRAREHDAFAGAGLAEVDAVGEQAADGLADPAAAVAGLHVAIVQHRRDRGGAGAFGAEAERLPDVLGCRRVGLEAAGVAFPVADGDARADVDAPGDGAAAGDLPVVADPGVLEFGDREHDLQREAAHRRRGVELVVHRDELAAGVFDASERLERADEGAAEPVELRDDDAVALAGLDSGDGLLEEGAVHAATGLVELDVRLADRVAVEAGPGVGLLALDVGADEGLAGAAADGADSDVGVESQDTFNLTLGEVVVPGDPDADRPRPAGLSSFSVAPPAASWLATVAVSAAVLSPNEGGPCAGARRHRRRSNGAHVAARPERARSLRVAPGVHASACDRPLALGDRVAVAQRDRLGGVVMESMLGLSVAARLRVRRRQLLWAAAAVTVSVVVAWPAVGDAVRAGQVAGRLHRGPVRVAVAGSVVPACERLVLNTPRTGASWGT